MIAVDACVHGQFLRGKTASRKHGYNPETITTKADQTKYRSGRIGGWVLMNSEALRSSTDIFIRTTDEVILFDFSDTREKFISELIIRDTFEKPLNQKIVENYFIKSKNSDQLALIYLFDTLLDLLDTPTVSNNFITYIYSNKFEFNSDAIVHILNAFKPIKSKLPNWGLFVAFCNDSLAQSIGLTRANQLIRIYG